MIVGLLFVITMAIAQPPEKTCGPLQNFWYNSKKLLLSPIYENLNYILMPTPIGSPPPVIPCQVCKRFNSDLTFEKRWPLIGIVSGIDVIAVLIRFWTGWDITVVPIVPVSLPLLEGMYLFDYCATMTLAVDVKPGTFNEDCFIASELLRCAIYNIHRVIPWIAAIVGFSIGFIIVLFIGLTGLLTTLYQRQ